MLVCVAFVNHTGTISHIRSRLWYISLNCGLLLNLLSITTRMTLNFPGPVQSVCIKTEIVKCTKKRVTPRFWWELFLTLRVIFILKRLNGGIIDRYCNYLLTYIFKATFFELLLQFYWLVNRFHQCHFVRAASSELIYNRWLWAAE